jgi:hypothetical protein
MQALRHNHLSKAFVGTFSDDGRTVRVSIVESNGSEWSVWIQPV